MGCEIIKVVVECDSCMDCPYFLEIKSSKPSGLCKKNDFQQGKAEYLYSICPFKESDPFGELEFRISNDGKILVRTNKLERWVQLDYHNGIYELKEPVDAVYGADGEKKKDIYPNHLNPNGVRIYNHSEWIKTQQRYCENCGTINNKNNKYCSNCGYHMRKLDDDVDDYLGDELKEKLLNQAESEQWKTTIINFIMIIIIALAMTIIN